MRRNALAERRITSSRFPVDDEPFARSPAPPADRIRRRRRATWAIPKFAGRRSAQFLMPARRRAHPATTEGRFRREIFARRACRVVHVPRVVARATLERPLAPPAAAAAAAPSTGLSSGCVGSSSAARRAFCPPSHTLGLGSRASSIKRSVRFQYRPPSTIATSADVGECTSASDDAADSGDFPLPSPPVRTGAAARGRRPRAESARGKHGRALFFVRRRGGVRGGVLAGVLAGAPSPAPRSSLRPPSRPSSSTDEDATSRSPPPG